jgi:Uncharacterized protein conserved in bacteria (DUF2188)
MPKGDVETYYEDGQWKNKIEGNERASNVHEVKAAAVGAGRHGDASGGRAHCPQDGRHHRRAEQLRDDAGTSRLTSFHAFLRLGY